MTTFTTNTHREFKADLNARRRHMAKAQVWRLTDMIPALFTRSALDPQKEIAKAERREAARRAADTLLR